MKHLAEELYRHMDAVPCDIKDLTDRVVHQLDSKEEEARTKAAKEVMAQFGVVLSAKGMNVVAGKKKKLNLRECNLHISRKNIYVQLGYEFERQPVTVPEFIEKFREIMCRSYMSCLDILNTPSDLRHSPEARPFFEQECMLLSPKEEANIVSGICAQVSYLAIRVSADELDVLPERAHDEKEKQIRATAMAKAGLRGKKRIFGELSGVIRHA